MATSKAANALLGLVVPSLALALGDSNIFPPISRTAKPLHEMGENLPIGSYSQHAYEEMFRLTWLCRQWFPAFLQRFSFRTSLWSHHLIALPPTKKKNKKNTVPA